jgi:adenine-specific DNA-methyltransferase
MPQELLARVIRACCPLGGRVLDPFAGSGSTLVAAERNGREAVGAEIDPKYVRLATERLVRISESERAVNT